MSPRSVRAPTRRRTDLPCVPRAGPSPPADGIGGRSPLRRPGDPERPAVDRRSHGALGGGPPIRYQPLAGTTWRRRRRLRPPSQVAPSANLLRAVVVTRPDETPELVHSPRGLARPSPVDGAPQTLFEFEPPADCLAEDFRPVDVPKIGHPLLSGGVDLDAHDLHGTRILLVILKDYSACFLRRRYAARAATRGGGGGECKNVHMRIVPSERRHGVPRSRLVRLQLRGLERLSREGLDFLGSETEGPPA